MEYVMFFIIGEAMIDWLFLDNDIFQKYYLKIKPFLIRLKTKFEI